MLFDLFAVYVFSGEPGIGLVSIIFGVLSHEVEHKQMRQRLFSYVRIFYE